jgi:hypothetical protein
VTGETATLFKAPVIAVIYVWPSMHHASSWHHPLDPPDLPIDPPESEVERVLVRVMPDHHRCRDLHAISTSCGPRYRSVRRGSLPACRYARSTTGAGLRRWGHPVQGM